MEKYGRAALESFHYMVWIDVIHYKVKVAEKTIHKALYEILDINKKGHKVVLGMYILESAGANFCL
ncbi:hypothetical protein V1387_18245 [Allomuricauda taeanensis]|uniref:hypothetical protein n=1 Tax=Flagellimonas taeanensis TaxID=1005926 RepID=UPI002E7C51E0|nr:hypothetical protein [Allomuricauda taeanensis]MEE1964632.1 hypothetical protein [Allomuricauda taeanensis]